MENMDRRTFLKGGAGLAAGAALLGAAGCAPSTPAANDALASTAAGELPADLKESDFEFSIVEREPITEFAAEETYDIVVVGAGCAGVPAVLTAVEEGAKVACLQKEATVSANGNGCSFVVKAHSNPAGIVRWRSDWARLNDWRINNELFNYYVEYAEEAVPWVISQGRSVGIEPIEFLTDSSIRYDDGGVVAVCDATQASNQDLMVALAQKAAEGGATFYYETPCVQLVQEEDGTVTGAIGKQKDGSYVKLNATKGVVLAAGDYMNNESMVDRNLRDAAMFPLCLVNHTGDGHILGILAGGRMAPLGHARQIHTNYIGPFMFYPFLALDVHGKRFCNETIPMSSLNISMSATYKPEHLPLPLAQPMGIGHGGENLRYIGGACSAFGACGLGTVRAQAHEPEHPQRHGEGRDEHDGVDHRVHLSGREPDKPDGMDGAVDGHDEHGRSDRSQPPREVPRSHALLNRHPQQRDGHGAT